jgi:hypothetical protein
MDSYMNGQWFTAAVRLRSVVDGMGPVDDTRSVFIFRASDWELARERAIGLGRAAEESYVDGDGRRVERRLVRVETLDLLGDGLVDGREVYFERAPADDDASLANVDPEKSLPRQSGV